MPVDFKVNDLIMMGLPYPDPAREPLSRDRRSDLEVKAAISPDLTETYLLSSSLIYIQLNTITGSSCWDNFTSKSLKKEEVSMRRADVYVLQDVRRNVLQGGQWSS